MGLFHVHKWFFSETAILTMYMFSAPELYTKRTAAPAKMVCIRLRRLLKDNIIQDGSTYVQALQLVVPRENSLQLCSKLTGHASDSMREPPSITFLYHLHEEIRAAAKVTVQPTIQD